MTDTTTSVRARARNAAQVLRRTTGALLLSAAASAIAAPWTLLSPADGPLAAVAGHPKRDGHYFARSTVHTVDGLAIQSWVSLDGGEKWRRAVPIDLDPSSRDFGTILAGGTPTRLYVEAGDRLLRSDDEGTTWVPLDLGVPKTPAPRLLGVNPLNGTEVVALGAGQPLRSTDAGATWTPLAGGAADYGSVDWFARVLYLVSTSPAQTRSLALDSGSPIGTAGFAPRELVTAGSLGLAITPGSLYRSGNNGVTWTVTLIEPGQVDFGGVALAPGDGAFAYVWEEGGDGRVWKTADRGVVWTEVGVAPCVCDWTGFAVSAVDANILVATTTAGAFRSEDGGATYTPVVPADGLPGADVEQVLSDAGDKKRKWLVTGVRPQKPLTSGNEGATWSAVNAAPNGDVVRPSFLHPDISGLLFGPGTPGPGGTTLWRSTDSGDVWKVSMVYGDGSDERLVALVAGPGPFDMIAVVGQPVAAGGGTEIYRSTNEGASWAPRTAPPGIVPLAAVRTSAGLLVGGVHPLKAAGDPTLWRSTDEGATWLPVELAPGLDIGITALGRARSVATRVYAGTDAGGEDALWRSDDGGLSWVRAARALGSAAVTSITVHPTLSQQVVIAQGVDGVFRSTDAGVGWKSLDAGLLGGNVTGVSFDASDARYLYASGASGAFRADLGTAPPATILRAVEYYYPPFGHYFITASDAEIDVLDRGVIPGWERTGFVVPVEEPDTQQRKPVCRFFSIGFVPRSSHFYTPYDSECELIKQSPLWTFEGIAFAWRLPSEATARCELGQRQLYRLYNDAKGGAPNHRYTTSLRSFDQMRAQGWIPEGGGQGGSFVCVPL